MTDREIYTNALKRYRKVHADELLTSFDVIVFLARECEESREKIKRMEERVKIEDAFSESVAEAVQEMANKWTALSERVEQLGQMVENKMDQVLGETVQTLTEFTTEQISDGGVMTIDKSMGYQNIMHTLLGNGYFVCCHFDDDGNTITIEYFRA